MPNHLSSILPTNTQFRTIHSKSDIKVPTVNLIHFLRCRIFRLEESPVDDHKHDSASHQLDDDLSTNPTMIHIHQDTIEIIQCE